MTNSTRREMSIFGALALTALAAGSVVAIAAIAASIRALSASIPFADAFDLVLRDPPLVGLLQLGGWLLATGIGVLVLFGGDTRFRDALQLTAVPARLVGIAIVAGLALQFPLLELTNLLADIMPSLSPAVASEMALRRLVRIDSLAEALWVPIVVVAVPAIGEELLFRGLIVPSLAEKHGPRVAVVVSAILFGLVHVEPLYVINATLAGLVLGHIRVRTDSIVACIAVHGAFNAMVVLLPLEVVRIEGFNVVQEGVAHIPLPLVISSALIATGAIYVMTRSTK